METKFQTSFIPRRPIPTAPGANPLTAAAPRHSRSGGGIFMALCAIIFACSLLSIAGAFFWQQYLLKAQQGYVNDLSIKEQQFDINLIRQLKAESSKITLAKQLLLNHVATSKLFGILSSLTTENVRFLTMDFTSPTDPSGAYQVAMSGYGKDLSTLAFQAKVLNKLGDYGISNVVRNPIVSNPAFNLNGTISFSLTANVDPSSLQYQIGGAATSSGQTQ